jgi:bifunctional NMN adenylyltransferase/nudix hydrolase
MFNVGKGVLHMSYKYDLAVFIGRFQPFHYGHAEIVRQTLKVSQYIAILVGGAEDTLTTRNPWNYSQRCEIILRHFEHTDPDAAKRIIFRPLVDTKYNDQAWIANVQYQVNDVIRVFDHKKLNKVALTGRKKDNTSYYLNLFPQWDEIEIDIKHHADLSATDVRNAYFTDQSIFDMTSTPVQNYLNLTSNTDQMQTIRKQFSFEENYRKQYGKGPFVTVDACVHQGGHILLIQRGREYCFGQYALPGGFLESNETIEEGVIRELMEETRIKVPEKVLRGCIKSREYFDDPYRGNRGRNITHCFNIELNNVGELPKVKGSDDAFKAMWKPFSFIDKNRDKFFDDHYHMIKKMLNI